MTAISTPLVLPGKALIVTALLIFPAILVRIYAEDGSQLAQNESIAQNNNLDILTLTWVLTAQFLHASTSDIFPTTLLTLNPFSTQRYKLNVCSRTEIATCMHYGGALSALAASVLCLTVQSVFCSLNKTSEFQGILATDSPRISKGFGGRTGDHLPINKIFEKTYGFRCYRDVTRMHGGLK